MQSQTRNTSTETDGELDRDAYALRATALSVDHFRSSHEKSKPWYSYFLRDYLPSSTNAQIVDMPCGTGNLLYALKELGYENATGYDIDPGQIAIAKQLGLNADCADILTYVNTREPESVDRIFSLDFLEHISKSQAIEYCRSVRRVLVDDGIFIARTPCCDGPFGSSDLNNDLTHKWGMTSGAAVQLLELAGFRREDCTILSEAPVPHTAINKIRRFVYKIVTSVLNFALEFIGIGSPKIWTRSMWIIAKKPLVKRM